MRGREAAGPATPKEQRHDFWGVVLDAPDAVALASFYADLLGWTMNAAEPDFVTVAPPDGVAYLAVQSSPSYVPPVWPPTAGQQQMMLHLDFEVSDLPVAAGHAVELGATVADHQPQEDVRVMLDPAGHPFCLYVGG